jgi:nucleotide-binding universal stress UspA family protein
MNEISIPTGAVVVGVDGSPEATRAVAWAGRLARDEGRPLVILNAVSSLAAERVVGLADDALDRDRALANLTESGQEVVAEEAGRVRHHDPGVEVRELVVTADPRQALLEAARAGASTVVVGSRGRGPLLSLLLGSVSATVARHAVCPVLVVRPHHPGRVRNGVLVGSDGTASSTTVVEAGFRVASERRLPLTVLHVLWDTIAGTGNPYAVSTESHEAEEARVDVAETIAGLREKFPDVRVQVRMTDGSPWQQLVTESESMDLLVVGRHDRGVLGRLMHGSVTIAAVEHAACPVLVVPVDATAPEGEREVERETGSEAPRPSAGEAPQAPIVA